MLTQDQKDLEPLTNHPKYGELLICAINTWEAATPKRGDYFNSNRECCLVGAAIGEPVLNWARTASIDFELYMPEIWTISDGFENGFENNYKQYSLERSLDDCYNFGKAVANIVLGK